MPGVSLILKSELSPEEARVSFARLKHRQKFSIDTILTLTHIAASFCGYDGYPKQVFETDHQIILIEGMIYNLDGGAIEAPLKNISSQLRDGAGYQEAVRRFMNDADGDYVVLIYLKDKNRLLFFNDRWGRLPIYYHCSDRMLALSREVKFILDWIPKIEFDQFAIAEFLTLEYILGEKTFIKEISRLGPASIIEAELIDGRINSRVIKELWPVSYRFEETGLSRRQAAGRYLELFRESLDNRIKAPGKDGQSLVTDLSGGYDTRAVFAGLCESGADFTACTDRLVTGDESLVAARLAAKYGRDVKIMEAKHPIDDIAEMTRILYITDGFVNCLIDTSCFYDDLEREQVFTISFANFKGMGGEFIRSVYMPKSGYAHLADAVMDDGYNHYMKIGEACSLLSLNRSELHDSLKYEIDGFNEADPVAQARHLFFEYNNKTVNSGEDRNRMFSWVICPLWGNQLFSFATNNIPAKYIDYNFFALFLKLLSPKSLDIPFYGSGVVFNSPMSRALFSNKMRIKRFLRDNRRLFKFGQRARRLIQPSNFIESENVKIGNEIRNIYDRSGIIPVFFNAEAVTGFLNSQPNRLHLYQLLTIVLYMAEIEKRYGAKLK